VAVVEVVMGIYIAIPVVIFGAGALIWVRDRWFPKRRRRLRDTPDNSTGSGPDSFYYGLGVSDGSCGSGGDSGGGGGGDGGGGSS
jgi:uncharacterized membrane protein YgcG